MKKDRKERRKRSEYKININKGANALNIGQFQIHIYRYVYLCE